MAITEADIARLSRAEVRRVNEAIRRTGQGAAEVGILVSGTVAAVGGLAPYLELVIEARERDEDILERLTEGVMPREVDKEHMEQLRLQSEARRAFLEEVAVVDSAGLADLLGSTASNRAAAGYNLKIAGRILALTLRGKDYYPVAQIVDGEVLPQMRDILEAFEGERPWTVALWLNAPSGWLNGERPLELLQSDPERVVEAARRSMTPLEI